MTKCISWHHPSGHVHVRDDVPDNAVCLDLGGWCPHDGERWNGQSTLMHFGRILAIGSEHVVCTDGLHMIPELILILTEERTDYVLIYTGRGGCE